MSGYLGIYLEDHLAGSTAGLELFKRAVRRHRGTPLGEELARLRDEVQQDRDALIGVMRTLGVPVRAYKVLGGWALERVGRLKPNGHLITRSPLSDLVELEGMRLGVEGKGCLWRALLELDDPRLDAAALQELHERALEQAAVLEGQRLETARRVLAGG